jgi:hypothetical protein
LKKMKNKILSLFLAVGLIGMVSCGEDFLDLDPNQSIALDEAIQSVDDYKAAIFGAYSQLQSSDYYGRYFVLVADVMSDDVKQNAQANRAREFSDYQQTALDGIAGGMFNIMYSTILRANTVINAEVELTPAAQEEANQYIGEAYALRALAHFDLVRMFAQHYGFSSGNDHLGVSIVTAFDQNSKPSRNTVAEVYTQIKSDLTTAVGLLASGGSAGRFTKEGAQALLARVALYQGNWSEAESMATTVINSGKFSLVSTDGYVASFDDGNSSETILEIRQNAADNRGSDALGRMYIVDGYGDYLPSQDVIGLIPDGDVRLGIFKPDETIGGVYGNVRMNKFPNVAGINNTPVIRLSEMYLIRAEARINQNKEDGARADINLIRKRGLPSAPDVTASGAALREEFEKERRIELMFEGHRLWDLMRWKRDIVRVNCTNAVCNLSYPSDYVVAPIPQAEIDANENIQQNPGY